jgi:hypothetical protein
VWPPPVVVHPSRDGGLVHRLNGLGRDRRFAGDALADVALVGAARRLVIAPEATYCHHVGCPHHASGLCGHWFNPPDNATGHDDCGFVRAFSHYAGQEPASAWSLVHGTG